MGGGDGVDGDVLPGAFLGKALGEAFNGGFGGGVVAPVKSFHPTVLY